MLLILMLKLRVFRENIFLVSSEQQREDVCLSGASAAQLQAADAET